jgi:hypothetical protein
MTDPNVPTEEQLAATKEAWIKDREQGLKGETDNIEPEINKRIAELERKLNDLIAVLREKHIV